MKMLIILALLTSMSSWAKSMTHQELSQLTPEQQVQVVEAYKEFLLEIKQDLPPLNAAAEFSFDFISKAFADAVYDCVYSGWPSVRVNGRCSSPARNNANYRAHAAECTGARMVCQPLIFGQPVLCANTSTQALRNASFQQCDNLAREANRTTSSIARALGQPPLSTEADELFQAVNRICTTGFQARTTMCSKLQQRLADIREARPAVSDAAPADAAPTVAATATAETPPRIPATQPPTAVPAETAPVEDDVAVTRALNNSILLLNGRAPQVGDIPVNPSRKKDFREMPHIQAGKLSSSIIPGRAAQSSRFCSRDFPKPKQGSAITRSSTLCFLK